MGTTALEINTLLFASVTARFGFMLIFMIASFKSEARVAFRFWTGSIIASSIGLWLMYSDPHYPYFLTIKGMIIYIIIGVSLSCLWAGGHSFFGRSVNWYAFVLTALLPGSVYGAARTSGLMPDLVLAFTLAVLASSTAVSAYPFLKRRERQYLPSQWLVGFALSIYIAALAASFALIVARVLLHGSSPSPGPQISEINLALFIDQLMSVLVYVGLVSMSLETVQLRIKELAELDPLSGLVNRRGLHDRAAQLINLCKRQKLPVAVLIMDIDHFKWVNDTYGHDGGDMILQEFGRRLSSYCRRGQDVASRWGGEEFLLLLNCMSMSDAVALAERFRRHVEQTPFNVGGQNITVTISIGVAEVDLRAPSLEGSVKVADDALYEAKRGGRNRVHYIDLPSNDA